MFMDPTKMGAQFFEQMEAMFVERFKEMLQSPAILSQVSKGVEAGLEGKKQFDGAVKGYLEKMNMPTREDVAKILQYLHKIESRIADLEEKIEDLGDGPAPAKHEEKTAEERPAKPAKKAAETREKPARPIKKAAATAKKSPKVRGKK
jgi:hypothetical protein